MRPYLILTAVAALTGCETTEPYEIALARVAAGHQGKTVQHFLDKNPHFSTVDAIGAGSKQRTFILETQPVAVTTTIPPYVPPQRQYNNPSLGRAFNGLNAAVGSVPGVSRSEIHQCRATIDAEHTGPGRTPADWTIRAISFAGRC